MSVNVPDIRPLKFEEPSYRGIPTLKPDTKPFAFTKEEMEKKPLVDSWQNRELVAFNEKYKDAPKWTVRIFNEHTVAAIRSDNKHGHCSYGWAIEGNKIVYEAEGWTYFAKEEQDRLLRALVDMAEAHAAALSGTSITELRRWTERGPLKF